MKGLPVNVRLDPELKERLQKVAAATGLDISTLIRMAIHGLVMESEEHGGQIMIPFRPGVVVERRAKYRAVRKK